MSLQENNESLRELAKVKIMSLAVSVFGNDINAIIPDILLRAKLYNDASLHTNDEEPSCTNKMIRLIYNNLSPVLAGAYDKAQYWSSRFSDDLNYPLNTGQIMRAFKGIEDKLIAEQVDTDFIVRTLENVGFDLSGWNKPINSISDELVVLPESRLNDNFSEPLAEKTSPAYPGYDVLADILPSMEIEGNEHYAMT